MKQNMYFLSKFGSKSLLDVQFAKTRSSSLSPREEAQEAPVVPTPTTTPTPALQDIALVFGSETQGLYGLIGEDAMRGHDVVYMPMQTNHRKNDIPSFNLAASVAMVTWEAWRQQQVLAQQLGLTLALRTPSPPPRNVHLPTSSSEKT
jgi:tRNA C32,U32 (ribose-2'-O)-methylase TrmJ